MYFRVKFVFLCIFELNQIVAINLTPTTMCLSCLVFEIIMAILVNQNLEVRAGVAGGFPESPYFFRQILSDMDTISQWHKCKFQNRGK